MRPPGGAKCSRSGGRRLAWAPGSRSRRLSWGPAGSPAATSEGAAMTYVLPDEHQLLRRTVRELADAKIAPAAADVDAAGRFPHEAVDALTGAGLHAVHIPEDYGGQGADPPAAGIVIEG